MDPVNLQYDEIKIFLFILVRVGVILFLLPFFNSRVIPLLTKAALALILTVLLYPVSGRHIGGFPDTLWGMSGLIAGEFIIGMVLGLLVQMFFEGIRMMGQLAGIETGFSIANVLDPQSGAQTSILSNMAYLIALVLFLILNGHHIILNAIRESFEVIQPGSVNLGKQVYNGLLQSSGDMFVIAVQISAPVVAAVLFVQVAFGLITRLIPQMNIMVVAFPVQIVTGLLFFGISLGVMLHFMERYVGGLDRQLMNMMALIKG